MFQHHKPNQNSKTSSETPRSAAARSGVGSAIKTTIHIAFQPYGARIASNISSMSALFPEDLAIAELHGCVRAPELPWIRDDAAEAIRALVSGEGIPATELRRIIRLSIECNVSIAPDRNITKTRNAYRERIGLPVIATNGASEILDENYQPRIPLKFRARPDAA
ncbi:MAG: hypothetical protein Greene041662_28 [Candidatus Peregrinibacteria bacterium Greene0416_62]|nr:MAG: hypothetical protein Greene041662_28 [Candidatus Peregrinibacteria bacterium Greene0416_62]TSC98686.1 MAG: hypothetical protein Greene101449_880 [Candidatus Peregrinibacteria bacterium Greene1014_49]